MSEHIKGYLIDACPPVKLAQNERLINRVLLMQSKAFMTDKTKEPLFNSPLGKEENTKGVKNGDRLYPSGRGKGILRCPHACYWFIHLTKQAYLLFPL